jgi:hypothetical protein
MNVPELLLHRYDVELRWTEYLQQLLPLLFYYSDLLFNSDWICQEHYGGLLIIILKILSIFSIQVTVATNTHSKSTMNLGSASGASRAELPGDSRVALPSHRHH